MRASLRSMLATVAAESTIWLQRVDTKHVAERDKVAAVKTTCKFQITNGVVVDLLLL